MYNQRTPLFSIHVNLCLVQLGGRGRGRGRRERGGRGAPRGAGRDSSGNRDWSAGTNDHSREFDGTEQQSAWGTNEYGSLRTRTANYWADAEGSQTDEANSQTEAEGNETQENINGDLQGS